MKTLPRNTWKLFRHTLCYLSDRPAGRCKRCTSWTSQPSTATWRSKTCLWRATAASSFATSAVPLPSSTNSVRTGRRSSVACSRRRWPGTRRLLTELPKWSTLGTISPSTRLPTCGPSAVSSTSSATRSVGVILRTGPRNQRISDARLCLLGEILMAGNLSTNTTTSFKYIRPT